MKSSLILFCVLGVSVAQTVTIDPVGPVTVVEGNILTINCSDEVTVGNDFILRENGVRLTGSNAPPSELIGTARIFHLPVDRTKNGNTYSCEELIAGAISSVITLTVTSPPTMPLNPRVVDLISYSAILQWDPPSDNGGSSLPLTYTVNVTNTSTSLPFSDISATSLPLPHLQHSTQYSWSVQAINEYGSSPPAEGTFTTPDSGSSGMDTTVIIGVVVAVVTVILIIIITVFVIVLVCVKHKTTSLIRCCKSGSSYDVKVELKGVHSHFEDVQLEPNPAYGEVTPSQAQTEPQPYEEVVAIGGVTSDGVAMEENPAYQAAEIQPYECAVGVTSSDITMEENPAYQSVDTTESQTEEPEYL